MRDRSSPGGAKTRGKGKPDFKDRMSGLVSERRGTPVCEESGPKKGGRLCKEKKRKPYVILFGKLRSKGKSDILSCSRKRLSTEKEGGKRKPPSKRGGQREEKASLTLWQVREGTVGGQGPPAGVRIKGVDNSRRPGKPEVENRTHRRKGRGKKLLRKIKTTGSNHRNRGDLRQNCPDEPTGRAQPRKKKSNGGGTEKGVVPDLLVPHAKGTSPHN